MSNQNRVVTITHARLEENLEKTPAAAEVRPEPPIAAAAIGCDIPGSEDPPPKATAPDPLVISELTKRGIRGPLLGKAASEMPRDRVLAAIAAVDRDQGPVPTRRLADMLLNPGKWSDRFPPPPPPSPPPSSSTSYQPQTDTDDDDPPVNTDHCGKCGGNTITYKSDFVSWCRCGSIRKNA